MLSDIRRLEVPGKHGQRGQTLLIFGLMFVFLMGIVGLATDSAFAYFRSISIERAAAAAALAGVPYMPNTYASGAPGRQDAYDRAIDEAARNGFVSGAGVTVTPAKTPGERELAVTITAPSQTFFMNALGFSKFNVVRTAVAGYKPPIALGQPGNQAGSTVSELGSGASFFFARYKGWNLQRSEGDAFTPNPDEAATGAGFRSKDVHQFSQVNGVESSALDCTSSSPFKMPCRGGYNWRIVVPAGQSAEVQVYNATYGPDLGTVRGNRCDNQQGLPTAYCNISGYHYHEDDIGTGSHCNPTCNAAQQQTYNATAYTLLDVPNVFLRSQDKVLTQTTVYPIDATNYDGAQGNTGINSPAQPSYINVKDNVTVNQYYDGTGAPCNMKIYHAWMDVANYSGNRVGSCPSGDNIVSGGSPKNLVERVAGAAVAGACGTPCVYNSPKQLSSSGSALGPGTYRLRVDALNFDGSFSTIGGNSSKGYAVRVVDAADKTAASCVGCSVSGWQGHRCRAAVRADQRLRRLDHRRRCLRHRRLGRPGETGNHRSNHRRLSGAGEHGLHFEQWHQPLRPGGSAHPSPVPNSFEYWFHHPVHIGFRGVPSGQHQLWSRIPGELDPDLHPHPGRVLAARLPERLLVTPVHQHRRGQ